MGIWLHSIEPLRPGLWQLEFRTGKKVLPTATWRQVALNHFIIGLPSVEECEVDEKGGRIVVRFTDTSKMKEIRSAIYRRLSYAIKDS